MKRFVLAAALAALAAAPVLAADDAALTTAAPSADLTLEVSGIDPVKGALRIAVYAGQAAYEGGGAPAAAKVVAVDAETLSIAFEGLAPGTYGIKLFHDVDGDGELDTNLFGIPSEPYAFSNSAAGRFGPASFEDARFEITAGDVAHAIEFD